MIRSLETTRRFVIPGVLAAVILSAVSCFDMYGEVLNGTKLRVGIFITTGLGNRLFYMDSANKPVERSELISALPFIPYQKVIAMDCDHDGDGDIAVISDVSDTLYLLLNNGYGRFPVIENYSIPGISVNDMDSADVNNDGKPEFVITQNTIDTIIFTPGYAAVTIPYKNSNISISKLDNDSRVDFYLTRDIAGSFDNLVVFNPNETGSSPTSPVNYASAASVFDSIACDIDRDSDNDIILVKDFGNIEIFKNDGTGAFSLSPDYTQNIVDSQSITAGDIDSDGDLDLYVGDIAVDNLSFYLVNNGYGSFSLRSTPVDIQRSVFFDIDFDGDNDLIGIIQTYLYILINDGAGYFTLHSSASISAATDITVFTFEED